MDINNLTKEDKLKIVTEAYRLIFDRPGIEESKVIHFICVAIECQFDETVRKKSGKVKGYQIIPEMLSYCPHPDRPDSPWFGVGSDDMEKRKIILEELMREFSHE